MRIELRRLVKRFGSFAALKGIDLAIAGGELMALLGPSGSGKTTLLRVIAGLEYADEGQVLFDGADAAARHVRAPRVGFVFQHHALFRHMTVFENVAFGLRVKPRRERRARRRSGIGSRGSWPSSSSIPSRSATRPSSRAASASAWLSPGRSRSNRACCCSTSPSERSTPRCARSCVAGCGLHDEMRLTSVFVTHDQEEALELADRVAVLNEGRLEQTGEPEAVYEHPETPFVYGFLGNVNRFACHMAAGRVEVCGNVFRASTHGIRADGEVVAYVHPHDVEISVDAGSEGSFAVIEHISAAGPFVTVELALEPDGVLVEAAVSRARYHELGLALGQRVVIRARKARIFARAPATGAK